MEMLAEMEGSDERLQSLNTAEHKPEDAMQTDEWMYELKHRQSWATGKYVPQDNEELKLDSKHFDDGARPPSSWQEHLVPQQIELVRESWCKIPKEAFAKSMHHLLLKSGDKDGSLFEGKEDEQATKIISTVEAVKEILDDNNNNMSVVVDIVLARVREYDLPEDEALSLFGDALLNSIIKLSGEDFTGAHTEAWGSAYKFLVSLIDKHK